MCQKDPWIDHVRSYTHLHYLDIWEGNSYSDTQSSQLEFPVMPNHNVVTSLKLNIKALTTSKPTPFYCLNSWYIIIYAYGTDQGIN